MPIFDAKSIIIIKTKKKKFMKRIYAALALLGATITGASAQSVDLLTIPVIDSNYHMPPTGKPFSITGIFDAGTPGGDSITAAALFAINPGSVLAVGDQVFYMATDATLDEEGSASGWLYTVADDDIIPEDVPITFAIGRAFISDSIHTLLNIENFEADSSFFVDILVKRENLVEGQTYGWYGYCAPYPRDAYEDGDNSNNLTYTPIIWGEGTSIEDLKNPKLTALNIFPNPTTESINFELTFADANKSTVARVLDISGRVVSTTNFGKTNSGTRQHSVNVASLPAGTYSLQVVTDHTISVEKFVKK